MNGDYYEHLYLSHFMDELLLQGKRWKEKLFLQIQSINNVYPNEGNMITVPLTKRMDIIISIQVCIISWVNINYKANGGKKCFSCKSMISAHNKKNRD